MLFTIVRIEPILENRMKKKLNRKQIRNLVLKEVKQLLEDAGSPNVEAALQDIFDVLSGGELKSYGYEIVGDAGKGQYIKVVGDGGNHMYNITVTEADEYKERSTRVK